MRLLVVVSVLLAVGCGGGGWNPTNDELRKLTALSDEQARVLSGLVLRQLPLDSLTTLTEKQAKELGKHRGWLELGSLPALTDTQAEALVRHRGWLSLDGLKTLS